MNRSRVRQVALAVPLAVVCLVVGSTASSAAPYEPTIAGTPSSDCATSKGDLGRSGVGAASARFNGASALLKAAVADDGAIVVADTFWIRVISGGQVLTILGEEGSEDGSVFPAVAVHGTTVYAVEEYRDRSLSPAPSYARIIRIHRAGTPGQERHLMAFLGNPASTYALTVDGSGKLWAAVGRDTEGHIALVTDGEGLDTRRTLSLQPTGLAVNDDGSRAYIVAPGSRAYEVDLRSQAGGVTELGTEGPGPVTGVARVALDRDGRRLFVGGNEVITSIDLDQPAKATDISPTPPSRVAPGSMSYDRTTKRLLVADLISCTIGTIDPAYTPPPEPRNNQNGPIGGVGSNPPSGQDPNGGNPVLTENGSQVGSSQGEAPRLTLEGQGSGSGAGTGAPEGGGSSAGAGSGAGDGGGSGQGASDQSALTGTRAEGDFGLFNPLANTGGTPSGSSFTPFAASGGQGGGGFTAGPAATDPFSGGGSLAGNGAPLQAPSVAAQPPVSVANPGPVGAAVPPPAASSPTPVQGWAGAPGDPAQGATRYAMVAEEQGRDLALFGLLGLGGCCLLFAVGAGTRRGGKAGATAAAAVPATAKAWAVGR